jgi:hypothetical protein
MRKAGPTDDGIRVAGVGVKPARVRLHIEELVLDGFSPGDSRRISEAFQTELLRLLTERGIPPSLVRNCVVDGLDAGEFRAATSGKALGAGLAGALYGRLNR